MKSEKIILIVFCVIFSALTILSGVAFVSLVSTSYADEPPASQDCTFLKYEYEIIERRKGADIERYYIYVQEYAEPLEIDQIVFDQVNREVLLDLNEGDKITVVIDKKMNLMSAERDGQYALTYEDYVAEHERNNTVGIIVTLILFCVGLGLIIFFIARYKKTGMVSDILSGI